MARFFKVAQTRAIVSKTASMPVYHGIPSLPSSSLDFLLRNGHSGIIA